MTPLSKPRAAIFDVDGTLALHDQRDPYDWENAASDGPNQPVIDVLRALKTAGLSIVYVSGRPEAARAITQTWLDHHVGVPGPLHLRESGDVRRDSIVKREVYENAIQLACDVVAVFDDRDQVVSMWRNELGLTCFQVAYGDF